MERGNLLVKTIEVPMHFARRLLQGKILCAMVTVIFLFTTALFDVIFRILRQKLGFMIFFIIPVC